MKTHTCTQGLWMLMTVLRKLRTFHLGIYKMQGERFLFSWHCGNSPMQGTGLMYNSTGSGYLIKAFKCRWRARVRQERYTPVPFLKKFFGHQQQQYEKGWWSHPTRITKKENMHVIVWSMLTRPQLIYTYIHLHKAVSTWTLCKSLKSQWF